jgi:small-conductance mechanosensitive channel/CRP-like cAMP-binding protein
VDFAKHLWNLGATYGVIWLIIAALAARASVLDSPIGSEPRARFRFSFSIFAVFLALLVVAALTAALKNSVADDLRFGTGMLGTLAGVGLVSVVVFEGLVRRVRPGLPRIVPDVLTSVAALIALMRASSQLGLDLSGVIATSAVLTAVIGLSLQDTLGNILGGLAVQLDGSIQVGDWVKVGDVSGRISEIRWRYTAIETRNWETVILPNSVLTRGQVIVLGRRTDQPVQWRRWVYFRVDYRHTPTQVITVVEQALRAQPIPNVAATPLPNCIAIDFDSSATKYAVRYWLTDLAVDDPTDSLIRTHIFFALARARMAPAIPVQNVFVTEHDQEHERTKQAEDLAQRLKVLSGVTLFRAISQEDRLLLAESLHRAPFTAGEVITREGALAHYLYIILNGKVSIRAGGIDAEHEVASLQAEDFFGEMALLTGEKRRATCVALTDVECYRLDASAFRDLLTKHPEVAEQVACVLIERQTGLSVARERVDEAQDRKRRDEIHRDLTSKIRAFFQLD